MAAWPCNVYWYEAMFVQKYTVHDTLGNPKVECKIVKVKSQKNVTLCVIITSREDSVMTAISPTNFETLTLEAIALLSIKHQ